MDLLHEVQGFALRILVSKNVKGSHFSQKLLLGESTLTKYTIKWQISMKE